MFQRWEAMADRPLLCKQAADLLEQLGVKMPRMPDDLRDCTPEKEDK